jgi:hypothetical protein
MVFMVVGCFFLMLFGFEIAWEEIMVSRYEITASASI